MKRRLTAWLTILAMLAGAVLPAQALAHVMRASAMSNDFCSAAGAGKGHEQPARGHGEACAACCDCSSGMAGTPNAPVSLPVEVAPIVSSIVRDTPDRDEARITVRARGPPHFA